MLRVLVTLLFTTFFYFNFLFADEKRDVSIAVLSYQSTSETSVEWQPLVDLLNKKLPEYRFKLLVSNYKELDDMSKKKSVDFILTSPIQQLYFYTKYGHRSLASVVRYGDKNETLRHIAGAIVVKTNRLDIQSIEDIKGKHIVAINKESLGGFLAQREVLSRHNIDVLKHNRISFIDMPHCNAVNRVLDEKADVAFVRAGVVESMIQSGKIEAKQVRVICSNSNSSYPYMVSTPLYPEWTMDSTQKTDEILKKKVLKALLDLDGLILGNNKQYSWDTPVDNHMVMALAKKYNLPPFDDLNSNIVEQFIEKYQRELFYAFGLLVVLALMFNFQYYRIVKQLRNEKEYQKLISDTMLDGYFVMDAKGIIVTANRSACVLLGYECGELIGESAHELIHFHKFNGYLDYNECPILKCAKESGNYSGNELFMRKDGAICLAEVNTNVIMQDGKFQGLLTVFKDISKRHDIKEIYNAIVSEAVDSIVLVDADSLRFVEFNSSAYTTLGYTAEQFLALTWADIQCGSDVNGDIARLLDKGKISATTKRVHKDGSIIVGWSINKKVILRDKVLFVSIWRDITEQLELQRVAKEQDEIIGNERILRVKKEYELKTEQEVSKAKDSFLIVLTHEFKTPLNSIINFSKYIEKNLASGSQFDIKKLESLAQKISNNAEDMLSNVSNLLDISRLKSNKLPMHVEKIEIKPLIGEIVSNIAHTFKDKTCSIDIDMQKEVFTVTDRTRFEQIVSNVLSNAMKYGNGRVNIKLITEAECYYLSIEDNGEGIKNKDGVFELFTSANNDLARVNHGSGVGLHFVKLLALELNISIAVEDSSTLGGAKFLLKGTICEG